MTTPPPSGRPAAAALGAGALCWIFIGVAHPRVGHGDVVRQITRFSQHNATVHALAIVAAAALLFGVATFSLRRGIRRSAVLAALIVYALGTAAVIAAATIDGFIVTGVAAFAASPGGAPRATTIALLALCGVAIQAFTKVGFAGVTIAIALWSADLVRDRGTLRTAGFVGCAAAVITAALVVATPRITPHAIVAIGLLQGVAYTALAVLLARNDV